MSSLGALALEAGQLLPRCTSSAGAGLTRDTWTVGSLHGSMQ